LASDESVSTPKINVKGERKRKREVTEKERNGFVLFELEFFRIVE
jgi:hypothetical protein